ncbi:MAG: hypothetical protein FWH32_07010 [Clostridiales bacterium]|nr:hypothetical protein [Clostridiales bacterium]
MENQKEQIDEQQLEGAAGGTKFTENRYDPIMCRGLTRLIPGRCCPFLIDCDHFNNEKLGYVKNGTHRYRKTCNMGAFPPYEVIC